MQTLLAELPWPARVVVFACREILRVKVRIRPHRGQPVESGHVQEVVAEMKKPAPDYQAWMVPVTCEAEKRPLRVDPSFRWPGFPPRRSSR